MSLKQRFTAKYAGSLLLIMILCMVPLFAYADETATENAETVTIAQTETAPQAATAGPVVDAAETAEVAVTEPATETAQPAEAAVTEPATETAQPVESTVTEPATETTQPAAAETTAADTPAEPAPAPETPAATAEPAVEDNAAVKDEPAPGETETPVVDENDNAAASDATSDSSAATTDDAAVTETIDATQEPDEQSAAETGENQGVRRSRTAITVGESTGDDVRTAVADENDDAGVTNISGSAPPKPEAQNTDGSARGLLEDQPSTLTATGDDTIVEAHGVGITREQALQSALVEAISKVNGTTLANNQAEEIRYQLDAVLESLGAEKNKVGGVSGAESLQWGIANRVDFITNGMVKSYEVISEGRIDKEYEINIRAVVAKYTPGVEVHRQRIAVMPFRVINSDGFKALYAELFTQRLVDYLAQSNSFAVLDRKFMPEKHAEFALLNSAETPVAERVRIGNTLGADYIVVGQINKMEYWLTEEKLPYMNSMQYVLTASSSFNMQIVVPATGMVVTSKTYDEKTELKFDNREGLKLEDIDQAEIDKLAAVAARRAGQDIINEIYPILAIAYNADGSFTLNQGGDTVKTGQKFNLRVYGDVLVDPYTKEELGRSENTIGKVEVTEVMPRYAIAKTLELNTMADVKELVEQHKVVLRPVIEQPKAKTAPPPATNQPKW